MVEAGHPASRSHFAVQAIEVSSLEARLLDAVELELRAGTREPYRSIARLCHLIYERDRGVA